MKRLILMVAVACLIFYAGSIAYADELVGMISRMDGNVGVISITKAKGLEPGMILYVYRAAKFIGRAEVSEVGSINSRIMALPECSGLRVGDAVSTRPACLGCGKKCNSVSCDVCGKGCGCASGKGCGRKCGALPPYGKNVSSNFILRETDGRSIVVGKIDPMNLILARDAFKLGKIFIQFQCIETAENFIVELSHTGNLFLELQPGTYVVKHVHMVSIAGTQYNAWGIPFGIIPGFFMKHGGKVFPISYKFTVPEKTNVVYIGTLKFNINPCDPYARVFKPIATYTSVVDEYDAGMTELRNLNLFLRRIGCLADTHLGIQAEKSIMELVPAGPGALFQQRGDFQTAVNEYLNSINYYEAPYRAEAHNGLAGLYWDKEDYYKALIHYDFAKKLGYPVPEDRMEVLARYRWYTRPSIE